MSAVMLQDADDGGEVWDKKGSLVEVEEVWEARLKKR